MENILVTTDQSTNSKAGIRFAIQLAAHRKASLTILQVYHNMKPSSWSDSAFKKYQDAFKQKTTEELKSFISGIYHGMDAPEVRYELVLLSNIDVVDGIMDYATKNGCAYICISTRGAGILRKIFGTNTAQLITKSQIPVVCVPSSYHLREIKHILYASDMTDYGNELQKVVNFARPFDASIDIIHISYPYEFEFDKQMMEAALQKKTHYTVNLLSRSRNMDNTLLQDLDDALEINKPSVLVLFTHQSKSMFEKLFSPSNSTAYSFYGKIPLLTFSKNDLDS